jgi:hypothetical protein
MEQSPDSRYYSNPPLHETRFQRVAQFLLDKIVPVVADPIIGASESMLDAADAIKKAARYIPGPFWPPR